MGMSQGGQVTHNVMFEEIRTGIIDGNLKFAAHIALYPDCNVRVFSPNVSGAPLLNLLAEKDDLTPPEPCVQYAQKMNALGIDTTSKVYPNAYHSFDGNYDPIFLSNAHAIRNCMLEYRLDTLGWYRFDTGERVDFRTYADSCAAFGATIGGHERSRAETDVRAFLERVW
jgi:dienelactone hydrolase